MPSVKAESNNAFISASIGQLLSASVDSKRKPIFSARGRYSR